MKVVELTKVEPGSGPRTVAIGTFDGVHLGHREVIRGSSTVLTFDPHPLSVIHPEATPKLISPFPVKRDLIAGLGVEELVIIPFDRGFSEQSAEEFVQDVLVARLGARAVSVGENFRFGKSAKGTAEFLASHDEFETRIVSLVEAEGETISSSHIRGLVAAGEVRKRPSSWALRSSSRARSCTATSAVASSACRPPTWCRTTPTSAGHGVYAATATCHRPGQPPRAFRPPSTSACARPSRPGAACSSRRT